MNAPERKTTVNEDPGITLGLWTVTLESLKIIFGTGHFLKNIIKINMKNDIYFDFLFI